MAFGKAAPPLCLIVHSARRAASGASSTPIVARSPLRTAISPRKSFMSTKSAAAHPRPPSPSSFDQRQAKNARRSSSSIVPESAAASSSASTAMTVEQTYSSAGRAASSQLLVKLDPEHPNAKAPTRGSAHAAGYDLYSSQAVVIPKGGRKVVQTGVRMAVPEGCYGRVAPRSGLASKHGIDVGAGVIDADYRGLVGVLLFNLGDEDYSVQVGDRIAQLVLERIETPDVVTVDDLNETVRGAGGFGSTGGFGPKEGATKGAE